MLTLRVGADFSGCILLLLLFATRRPGAPAAFHFITVPLNQEKGELSLA